MEARQQSEMVSTNYHELEDVLSTELMETTLQSLPALLMLESRESEPEDPGNSVRPSVPLERTDQRRLFQSFDELSVDVRYSTKVDLRLIVLRELELQPTVSEIHLDFTETSWDRDPELPVSTELRLCVKVLFLDRAEDQDSLLFLLERFPPTAALPPTQLLSYTMVYS